MIINIHIKNVSKTYVVQNVVQRGLHVIIGDYSGIGYLPVKEREK